MDEQQIGMQVLRELEQVKAENFRLRSELWNARQRIQELEREQKEPYKFADAMREVMDEYYPRD